jgi:Zn-dependent peptidase ImmA (M78 family)/DNA-binding XRE family transcriptional regulator
MAIGSRIKQARLQREWSQRDLAAHLSVSDTTVSNYEQEKSLPDSSKLMEIAEALEVDLSYFLRVPRVGAIEPAYRKLASMRKSEEKALLERIRDWLERYLEVESILEIDGVEFEWPAEFPRRVSSAEEIEEAAIHLRDAWQIGRDPIENLTERLEDHGLRVGSLSAPDSFDACAIEADVNGGIPAIVFNEDRPGDRQRYNMAHELGHLVLNVEGALDEEDACHRFGAAFLVPARSLIDDVGQTRRRVRLRELELLKQKYGMSMQALVYRMRDLDILQPYQARRWFKWFKTTGQHEEEPGGPVPQEQPRRFERMVQHALAEELITERRAEELLGHAPNQTSEPVFA